MKVIDTTAAGFSGPSWDLEGEYKSFSDPTFHTDLQQVETLFGAIEQKTAPLAEALVRGALENETFLPLATELLVLRDEIYVLISNLATYCSCLLSVNGSDDDAKKNLSRIERLKTQTHIALGPLSLWLTLVDQSFIDKFLALPQNRAEKFRIERLRLERDHVLPLAEENLIKTLEQHGPTAFGHLYTNVSATLKCTVETEPGVKRQIGLAEASNLLNAADEKVRQSAYRGINAAWQAQEELAAAVINHQTGFRHDIMKKRSYRKPLHFLTPPLQQGCITEETLEAMFHAVSERQQEVREAHAIQARMLDKTQLGPWDLMAPFPSSTHEESPRWTFDAAIALISEAFAQIDPQMGEFVEMAADKRWIEATSSGNKRPGAYCTKFPKSRTPRVYMTFNGSLDNVTTLAHELGHAFHGWVMRDLPFAERSYPMTLAETASILAETVVVQHLFAKAGSFQERLLPLLWNSVNDASSLLLNIPARFIFEKKMNEMRSHGILTASEMKQLMQESWSQCYGKALSEMNEMFWASKLHFHISSLSFYNFPYTFGYLFSLGVYAQRQKLGNAFFQTYVDLLRDTGRMTAEELAERYLGTDIRHPSFWNNSLDIVSQQLALFSKAAH
jgi:oligoendopeptidase F